MIFDFSHIFQFMYVPSEAAPTATVPTATAPTATVPSSKPPGEEKEPEKEPENEPEKEPEKDKKRKNSDRMETTEQPSTPKLPEQPLQKKLKLNFSSDSLQ